MNKRRVYNSVYERFMAKVGLAGNDECWEWLGGRSGGTPVHGKKIKYGEFNINGKMMYAHRLAFAFEYGPFDTRLHICHKCDNPGCVNPRHLFAATRSENMRDMVNKGRATRTPLKGSSNGNAKITEEDVRWIKSHPEVGRKELMRMFGVSRSTIDFIRSGRNWAHITVDKLTPEGEA